MKEERFPEALSAFKEAHKLAPSSRTVAQKGLAEQAMHLWLPAEEHMRLALENEIVKHIGTLYLELGPSVHDVRLTAAGEWIPWTSTGSVRLPEGEIVLQAEAPGYLSWRRTVVVRPGVVLQIPVELVAAQAPPPPPPPQSTIVVAPPMIAGRAYRAPTWLVVSLGVVGVTAILYGIHLITIDGRPSCDGAQKCASVHDTRTPGMLLVGAGAAIGLGGGVVATW
jgi:hypothetical protein